MIRKCLVLFSSVLLINGCASYNTANPVFIDGPPDKTSWSLQGVSDSGATSDEEFREPVLKFIKEVCPKKTGSIRRFEPLWRTGALNQMLFGAIVDCDK